MRKDFLVGIDLAKRYDFAAFVGVSRVPLNEDKISLIRDGWEDLEAENSTAPVDDDPLLLRVEYTLQVPRGTSYYAIAEHAATLAEHPKLKGRIQFAVDVTGVGEAVLEILEARPELDGLLWCIQITPGQRSSRKKGMRFGVPKKDLKDSVLVKLQQKRLVANPLESHDMERLRSQMYSFKKKYTEKRNVTFEAESETDHDDLVMALASLCWLSDQLVLEDQGEWQGGRPEILLDGPEQLAPRGYPTWRGGGESTTHRPAGNGPVITPGQPMGPPSRNQFRRGQ